MNHEKFMIEAIEIARKSREQGNEPFGAVLVKNGEVVKKGENGVKTFSDPTHHAELGLIRDFCSENQIFDLREYTLYTSCEPCVMCCGAMVWSNLGKMVYSVTHEQLEKIAGSNILIPSREVFERAPMGPEVIGPILNEEGLKVFEGYVFE